MKIKAGSGVKIARFGDSVRIYSDDNQTPPRRGGLTEGGAPLVDFTGEGRTPGADPYNFTTWERGAGDICPDGGIKIKALARSYYDKDADKNYNFYLILTFSDTGQLLKAEGELRETAYETTLHEHPL